MPMHAVRVFLLFAFLVPLLAAHAQTTATLRVQVLDDGGDPVPNARVEVSSPILVGGTQAQTTGATGELSFAQLPPGAYAVAAEHPTLFTSRIDGIGLRINTVTNIALTMRAGETVEVTAREKPIEQGKTSNGSTMDRVFLERLPGQSSTHSVMRAMKGISVGSQASTGNFNASGAGSNENTFLLDGANITDPVTGTFSSNFNRNAVEQVELLLGGYMPEIGGVSLGGVVNLVTQTGGNTLEFSSSIYYANGNWRPRLDERIGSDGVTLAPTGFDASFSNLDVQAKVSGPIVRDKVFFILTYTLQRSQLALSGTPQKRDGEKHSIYGKLTFQPDQRHRFTAGLQLDPTTLDNQVQGTPFIKGSAQSRQAQGGFASINKWQWALAPQLNVETLLTLQKTFINTGSVPCTHNRKRDHHRCRPGELEGAIDDHSPARVGLGGAYDSVNNTSTTFDDRWRIAYGSKLAVVGVDDPLGGRHDLKFGMAGEQLIWNNLTAVNGNTLYVDTNAASYDPSSFANQYWLEYSGPQVLNARGSQFNFFLQDSWRPTPNLTVNFGTRFDHSVMRNAEGLAVVRGATWGPRLHAAWDPTGDGKSKVAGGYGRFNDTGRLGVANLTSQTGFGSKLYIGENLAGSDASGQGFLSNSALNYSYSPTRNLNTAHDRLRSPSTDEVLLILEREVFDDVAMTSSATARFTRNLYEYDDVSTTYGQGGLDVIGSRYGDADTARYRVRTPRLAKRDVFNVDVGARKIWAHRWAAAVNYTFTRSLGSSTQSLSGSFANDQQTAFNHGRILTDQTHVVRAQAVWDLPTDPWTQQLGVFFLAASGAPMERFYYGANPGGDGYTKRLAERTAYTRLSPFWDLSVRLTQQVPVRKGKLGVSVEATNLTNNRAGGLISTQQLATDNRYVLFSRQDPLRLQVGATYTY